MIKAVIFDIDGVLLDSIEANAKFFQDLLVKAGYKKPTKAMYKKTFHLTFPDVIRFLTKEKSDDKMADIIKIVPTMKFPKHLIKIPDECVKTISKLAKKYKIGLVTARPEIGVEQYFEFSKMKKYFEIVVASEHYKNPKPHPEPLLVAAKKLKIKPEEAVYIGDQETDRISANKAGMNFILFGPNKINGNCATHFKELPAMISKL